MQKHPLKSSDRPRVLLRRTYSSMAIAKLSALFLSSLIACASPAQNFSSGSDGSYGPLNITSNTTLTLPSNGTFNCTTITIASGATLTFNRNPLNTPVYLLATSNVLLNGYIDVSGKQGSGSSRGEGGPGGFDGGNPGLGPSVPPGAGYGPGGGKGGPDDNTDNSAGAGAYGSVPAAGNSTNKGASYGSPLLVPLKI